VASRTEQKAKAREERLAREREAQLAERRKRRLRMLATAAAAVVIVVVVAIAVAAGGGDSKSKSGGKTSAGLSVAKPPWAPETAHLSERIAALGLPPVGNETYHVHAVLRVFVDGQAIPVPQGVGIDQNTNTFAPLHTHDQSGVIHMETDDPYPFTLGQFFTIWGVKFTPTQLGGLVVGGANKLETFVNGKPVANPQAYKPKSHDKIVVAYGKAGSAPKTFDFTFPQGE
jgi:hypothetical protein